MQTRNIKVPLRDGVMGGYLAVPDGPPKAPRSHWVVRSG